MNEGIRIDRLGGPEVLQMTELPEPRPGPGEIAVDVEAAGVNFIDTYQRSGLYPIDVPFVPGLEGAGVVAELGDGVDRFAVGERVAWTQAIGSYQRRMAMGAESAVSIPDDVDTKTAAAAMLQGLTAHYLVRDTFPLTAGRRALVHAGAGGVGLLLIQAAKLIGAEVFTTVGTPDKAEIAREAGADHVILYRDVDFGDAVEEIAGPRPIDVIYDGVGASTFARGLEVLRPRGMMVTFGNASGPVDPVSPLELMQNGSVYLTRPKLFDYISERSEFEGRVHELMGWIGRGELVVHIGAEYPLAEAAAAHAALEGRQTTGKVLLV